LLKSWTAARQVTPPRSSQTRSAAGQPAPAAALASFLLLCLGGGVIIYAIAAFAHLRHRYRRL